jgi:hypothetical protein
LKSSLSRLTWSPVPVAAAAMVEAAAIMTGGMEMILTTTTRITPAEAAATIKFSLTLNKF